MITIDITMVIQIINILFLIVVMNAVLYKPIRNILSAREEKIGSLDGEIDTFIKNTKLRQEEIDKKIQESRSKAKGLFEETRSGALAETAGKLSAVRDEATTAKNQQLDEIQKQFTGAREELSGQVNNFASEMAGKILGRSL